MKLPSRVTQSARRALRSPRQLTRARRHLGSILVVFALGSHKLYGPKQPSDRRAKKKTKTNGTKKAAEEKAAVVNVEKVRPKKRWFE